MSTIGLKKTLNLHKYNVKLNSFILDWKIVIPVIFSIAGLVFGCEISKGEGGLYLKVTDYFSQNILGQTVTVLLPYFLRCLVIPSVFIALLFFFGMSAYGGVFANIFPFVFSFFTGIISYYMYSTYTLKGLAYCMIIIFPYAVLTLISIVLCTVESIKMSDLILKSISKSNKFIDYNFKTYYLAYAKNYSFVLLAAVVKIILDYLFGALFNF